MAEQRRPWARAMGTAAGAAALVAVAAVAVATSSPSPDGTPPASEQPAVSAQATPEASEGAAEAEPSERAEADEQAGENATPRDDAGAQQKAAPGERARESRPDDTGPPPWAGPNHDKRGGPVTCEDARNHGEYVSSVARSTPPGPDKDSAVSAAAESDCPPGFRDRPDDEADAEE